MKRSAGRRYLQFVQILEAKVLAALLTFEISVDDLCQVKEKSIRFDNLLLSFGYGP